MDQKLVHKEIRIPLARPSVSYSVFGFFFSVCFFATDPQGAVLIHPWVLATVLYEWVNVLIIADDTGVQPELYLCPL